MAPTFCMGDGGCEKGDRAGGATIHLAIPPPTHFSSSSPEGPENQQYKLDSA